MGFSRNVILSPLSDCLKSGTQSRSSPVARRHERGGGPLLQHGQSQAWSRHHPQQPRQRAGADQEGCRDDGLSAQGHWSDDLTIQQNNQAQILTGFEVEIYRNLTSQGMNCVKRKLTEDKLHRDSNCFLFLIISHGTADNFLLDRLAFMSSL